MTTPNAYRTPTPPDPVRPRYRWTLSEWGKSDGGFCLVLVVVISCALAAGCFVAYGAAPFVARWAAVNLAAAALWCLAFVRREVAP